MQAAFTTLEPMYPGYINVSRQPDGSVAIVVRGNPKSREGLYVCGFARDKGAPGRCTPGDDRCNNYCNMAPQKGPMVDHPAECVRTSAAETARLTLSAADWATFVAQLED